MFLREKKGRAEGKAEGMREGAINAIHEGFEDVMVARIFQMTVGQVQELRRSLHA